MQNEHYKKLENMYYQARVNTHSYKDSKITISEGRSSIYWEVDPNFFHAMEGLHGSAYFKLLDDAAYFAASSLERDFFIVTSSFEISFRRPVEKGILRSEGKVTGTGKQKLAEARLYDNNDKLIAAGKGNFARTSTQLSEKLGYKL